MAMAWDAMGTTFDSLIDPLFKINRLLACLQDLESDLFQIQEDTPGYFLEANHAIKQALAQARQAIRAIEQQQRRHLFFFTEALCGTIPILKDFHHFAILKQAFYTASSQWEIPKKDDLRNFPIRNLRRFLGAICAKS